MGGTKPAPPPPKCSHGTHRDTARFEVHTANWTKFGILRHVDRCEAYCLHLQGQGIQEETLRLSETLLSVCTVPVD
jgi:hypothetical protein